MANWRCVSLLVPTVESRVNGYIIFSLNIWRVDQKGNHGHCSSKVYSSLSWIHKTLVIVSALWTEHGYIATSLRPNNILNNGLQMESLNINKRFRLISYGDSFLGLTKKNLFDYLEKVLTFATAHYTTFLNCLKTDDHNKSSKTAFLRRCRCNCRIAHHTSDLAPLDYYLILYKGGCDCINEILLCGIGPILLCGKDPQAGATVDEAYELKGTRCAKMSYLKNKILWTFHTAPVHQLNNCRKRNLLSFNLKFLESWG